MTQNVKYCKLRTDIRSMMEEGESGRGIRAVAEVAIITENTQCYSNLKL